jgi:hypothetical protein
MFKILALVASFALAHFEVVYPEGRAENEEFEEVAPCGGGVLGERNFVPITGSRIGVEAFHKEAIFDFKISFQNDPQTTEDFETTISERLEENKTGELFTAQIDYSAFGAQVGQNATIQIISDDEHLFSYRCIDVTFINF